MIQVEPCPHTPISALSPTGSAVFIRNELVSGIYPCRHLPDASNLQFFYFILSIKILISPHTCFESHTQQMAFSREAFARLIIDNIMNRDVSLTQGSDTKTNSGFILRAVALQLFPLSKCKSLIA